MSQTTARLGMPKLRNKKEKIECIYRIDNGFNIYDADGNFHRSLLRYGNAGKLAVFVRPMLALHDNLFTALWLKQVSFHLPLIVLNGLKIVVITVIAIKMYADEDLAGKTIRQSGLREKWDVLIL